MAPKILITGATGFIGKNLAPLIVRSKEARFLVRPTSNIGLLKNLENAEIVLGDLEQNYGLPDALDDIEIVIHCAARTMGKNYFEFYNTNTLGTINITSAMKKKAVKKILFLSSQAACGPAPNKRPLDESTPPRPISFYGRTKYLAEQAVIQSGLQYTILRPVSVYGPYDLDILRYIKLLNLGLGLIPGWGEKYINLIYVADLVRVILKIIESDSFHNRIYFINDGNIYKFSELFDEISKILKKKNIRIYIPKSLSLLAGLFNDIFLPEKRRLISRDKVREISARYWVCNDSRAVTELNFKPEYSLEKGLKKTIKWYQEQGYI